MSAATYSKNAWVSYLHSLYVQSLCIASGEEREWILTWGLYVRLSVEVVMILWLSLALSESIFPGLLLGGLCPVLLLITLISDTLGGGMG